MTKNSSSLSLAALVVLLSNCNRADFDPVSKVESVRILAIRADEPYATPGDTVNLDVLAFDGRATQPEPMQIFWLPTPCIDPTGDAYYACYPGFAQSFQPGVDLTPLLLSGQTFSFPMPTDVIGLHQGSHGAAPYGLAVAFAIACAGHVEFLAPTSDGSPEALPFGCFDINHNRLGPSDFVISYAQIYSFPDRSNENPVIENLLFAGAVVDAATGIVVDHCAKSDIDQCATNSLGVTLSGSSQEADPSAVGLKEQLYVDYFLTSGKVKHDAMILADAKTGSLPNSDDAFYSPLSAGDSQIWAVVHDNRGGVAWVQVAVHAQ